MKLGILLVLLGFLALPICAVPAFAGDSTEVQLARALGDEGTIAYLSAAVLMPVLQDGEEGRGRSFRTADAIASAALLSYGLKHVIKRDRPDGMGDDSMPSMHSTVAFAAATMAADAHPDEALWWYGGAALIGWSRIRENRHRPEEVLGGAAIGYGMAKLEQQLPRGMLIAPFIDPDGESGVEFIVNF